MRKRFNPWIDFAGSLTLLECLMRSLKLKERCRLNPSRNFEIPRSSSSSPLCCDAVQPRVLNSLFFFIASRPLFFYLFQRVPCVLTARPSEFLMKKLVAVLFLVLVSPAFSQVPSVQVKIKEKSGFLGMGGPKFIELRLSSEQNQLPLTSTNVNAGSYYYFLCRSVGTWILDEDFFEEDLPRLSIVQSGQTLPTVWKADSLFADSTLLIGFHKQLLMHQPFAFQFPSGDSVSVADMKVPAELWPGYTVFTDLSTRADHALSAKQYRNAAALYNQILQDKALEIFPEASQVRSKRTHAFESYYNEGWASVNQAFQDTQKDLKSKIAEMDVFRPNAQYVLDSLPNPTLAVADTEPAVGALLKKAGDAMLWIKSARDSLQSALDDQNVRWILEGSSSGRTGFQFLTVVDALGTAFSTINFSDTISTMLLFSVPEEVQATLAKNNLTESYETFLRLTNERHHQGLTLFPFEFLANLQKDTVAFRLPFYSMFKAVNDYFNRNYTPAKQEIFRIFRTCTDADVSARFDQMRVLIRVRQGLYPSEALNLLDEAAALEASNPETAGEKYRQATILAPTFAYASFSLGKFYARTGDPIRAQTFFERAYQTDTLYLSAYRESFNLYRRSGNYKPMIEVLTRALQRGNDYWETHSNLGLAFMGDGDPARAIQHYERALTINPKSYATNIQLGLAYQAVKNFQKARDYFNNAINIDPLRQEAVEYLTRLNELQRGSK